MLRNFKGWVCRCFRAACEFRLLVILLQVKMTADCVQAFYLVRSADKPAHGHGHGDTHHAKEEHESVSRVLVEFLYHLYSLVFLLSR